MSYFLLNEMDKGTGQTYYMWTGQAYEERAVVVIKPLFAAHPNQCGASRNRTVFAHELSHVSGGSHNRAVHPNGNGTYAYHNGEPYHRRKEAYDVPVSQHEQTVYTVTAYPAYRPGPNNETTTCIDCTRLSVLSSPDLWWFFRTNDPLSGHCLAVDQTEEGLVQLACQNLSPYVLEANGYALNEASFIEMSPSELVERAIPLGVDEPSFIHPDTGELIEDPTSSRVRDVVLSTWTKRAGVATPLDPSCGLDCAIQNRVTCGYGTFDCGPCLPGFVDFEGTCYPRREANTVDTLHDESYDASGVHTAPLDSISVDISLEGPSDVAHVEVYLGTVDASGESDDTWALLAGFTLGTPAAPPHSFVVKGVHADGTVVTIGSNLTPGAIAKDSAGQNDHSLTYLFPLESWLDDVTAIRIELSSESEDYGFSLLEVRTFGRAATQP